MGLPQYSKRPKPGERGVMVSVKHPEYVRPGVRNFGAPEAGEEGGVGEGLGVLDEEEEVKAARTTAVGGGQSLIVWWPRIRFVELHPPVLPESDCTRATQRALHPLYYCCLWFSSRLADSSGSCVA